MIPSLEVLSINAIIQNKWLPEVIQRQKERTVVGGV